METVVKGIKLAYPSKKEGVSPIGKEIVLGSKINKPQVEEKAVEISDGSPILVESSAEGNETEGTGLRDCLEAIYSLEEKALETARGGVVDQDKLATINGQLRSMDEELVNLVGDKNEAEGIRSEFIGEKRQAKRADVALRLLESGDSEVIGMLDNLNRLYNEDFDQYSQMAEELERRYGKEGLQTLIENYRDRVEGENREEVASKNGETENGDGVSWMVDCLDRYLATGDEKALIGEVKERYGQGSLTEIGDRIFRGFGETEGAKGRGYLYGMFKQYAADQGIDPGNLAKEFESFMEEHITEVLEGGSVVEGVNMRSQIENLLVSGQSLVEELRLILGMFYGASYADRLVFGIARNLAESRDISDTRHDPLNRLNGDAQPETIGQQIPSSPNLDEDMPEWITKNSGEQVGGARAFEVPPAPDFDDDSTGLNGEIELETVDEPITEMAEAPGEQVVDGELAEVVRPAEAVAGAVVVGEAVAEARGWRGWWGRAREGLARLNERIQTATQGLRERIQARWEEVTAGFRTRVVEARERVGRRVEEIRTEAQTRAEERRAVREEVRERVQTRAEEMRARGERLGENLLGRIDNLRERMREQEENYNYALYGRIDPLTRIGENLVEQHQREWMDVLIGRGLNDKGEYVGIRQYWDSLRKLRARIAEERQRKAAERQALEGAAA
jgi:hypothetical protein